MRTAVQILSCDDDDFKANAHQHFGNEWIERQTKQIEMPIEIIVISTARFYLIN